MTNKIGLGLLIAAATWISRARVAHAYPENVRHGYGNCASCHVSPTGGGLLTTYGRGASEEFLSTWHKPKEGNLLHGAVALPEWLLAGGEFRSLSYWRDTNVYKARGIIPMQAQADLGVTYKNRVTGVVSAGLYNKNAQIQQGYILANFGENLFVRSGKFFPAFGINTPEHTLVTRRGLGFDEGQQSLNMEFGLVCETGEIIADVIIRPGMEELSHDEKGYSLRVAWYAGGRSQLGLSWLSLNGNVWERRVAGAFITTGVTPSVYISAEIDQELKSPIAPSDPSTPQSKRFVSASKVGWEFHKGVHLLANYESSVNTLGTYDPRIWAIGPGIQWFPRPHFEILAQAQRRLDETWSNKPGSMFTVMTHYNL